MEAEPNGGQSLPEEYRQALARYVDAPDEELLSEAYELGRRALGSGGGLLEIIATHHQALAALAAQQPLTAEQLERGEAFCREVLSAFEMAHRGFKEAYETLRMLNTELKGRNEALLRAKEVAESAHRELEAFSYSVSHDLRAPVRAVDGFVKAALEDGGDTLNPQVKQHLGHVQEASSRMGQLIDDLLRLSRVSAGALRRTRVDVGQLADAVLDQLARANPSRQVAREVTRGMFAEADPTLLRVALENLLSNAWKFSARAESPRIEVGVEKSPNGPVYFVRDNGAGFDMAHADRLFTPFVRLHPSKEFEGTGIGLATTWRVIRRHGGKIWAEATPGQGATFRFTLPPEVRP